ncbi:MAG: type II TA system antitoxin MqsA family protein [Bacteroidales bacterium]|jgi:putative zinc finger/helix-turn-helix YgiT family protein
MKKVIKAYCEKCDKDIVFATSVEKRAATIRDKKFEYDCIVAKCKECGEEVYPAFIDKTNEIAKYDKYKSIAGLLTSQEIIDLRKKLGLTQVDFAKKLGCGEKTIARYENGSIQDKVIDQSMRKIKTSNYQECYITRIIHIKFENFHNAVKNINTENDSDNENNNFSIENTVCHDRNHCYC